MDAPQETATQAGLRYVNDEGPGIKRRRAGKKMRYFTPDGTPVTDDDVLGRIRALGIPRPGRMSGSARVRTAIFRRLAATHGAANSTATIPAGARCATPPNTNACFASGRRCRNSAPG